MGQAYTISSGGLPVPIDHTGINLGNKIYISARDSERRPVWSMQPQSGVQITEVPSEYKYNYR